MQEWKSKTAGALALVVAIIMGGCGPSSNNTKSEESPAPSLITYTDYKGATREAATTPGAAEYHAGTGYGQTLFDSAERKCQHCHNELYDTWKGSMHGRSWSDPIFQSKYQDYLRITIDKIGEDNSAKVGAQGVTGRVLNEQVFKGAAQVCVACHAPGAYYAGDFKIELEKLKASGTTTADLSAAQAEHQANNSPFDPTQSASVVAVAHTDGALYKATYHIGHEANREGINCAFCHSIETPRLMGLEQDGGASGTYTLKDHLRVGAHGPAKYAAGSTLNYDKNASAPQMNAFFKIVGPESYTNYAHTPKASGEYDVNKAKDGRYSMTSKDLNGTNGKTHYTGGPFYGPYGVTGLRNENASDETNRSAQVHPDFHYDTNNHFGANGKGLCLSCHQRSAGASVPAGEEGAGSFMELCSTWTAVSTGTDNNLADTDSSPRCQKCHMEKIEGTVLHQWGKPDQLFTDKALLTAHFYADDSEGYGNENPVKSLWLNSHGFLGASKTGGDPAAAMKKVKSGFAADLNATQEGNTLSVQTTLLNKTAHMLPGAHPMRRLLTRVIVTDAQGNKVAFASATGLSTFEDVTNSVVSLTGKTLHESAHKEVSVNFNGSDLLDFPGKSADLEGSAVQSQKFDGTVVSITGTDSTVLAQEINGTQTVGTASRATIIDSASATDFTRIYGRETGKKYNGDYVVRPGFDSNLVRMDNRLSPNERETYTLTYDLTGLSDVNVTMKVYYMQKGANGKFPATAEGFLDDAVNAEKKFLITEVFSKTIIVQ